MIFLVPLLLIIAVIFGVDYLYFNDKTEQKQHKSEENLSLQKQNYIKSLFEKK